MPWQAEPGDWGIGTTPHLKVSGQGPRLTLRKTVHLMTGLGVLRVLVKLHREEGRNVRELKLYTTDDLRRLYQATESDIIRLRDGIIRPK